jgi:hypothetical protein
LIDPPLPILIDEEVLMTRIFAAMYGMSLLVYFCRQSNVFSVEDGVRIDTPLSIVLFYGLIIEVIDEKAVI